MVTAVYSFSHFAVDLGCAFAVFSASSTGTLGFLLYNFFAFAMQMPMGLLADIWGKNKLFALTGTVIVGICCCLPSLDLVSTCLLGLGNGLFHIGGGTDILNRSNGKSAPLGFFVSPGAFGVYLGTIMGKSGWNHLLIAAMLLLTCGGMLVFCREAAPMPNGPTRFPDRQVLLPAALLFAVVVLRSYGGMTASFEWKTGGAAFAAVGAVVLGKAFGGILADRFGSQRVSLCSLGLSALLFLLGDAAPAGLAALLLFNMTMPVTLHALAQRMSGLQGFSFGLLTFALFLGFLPSYFGADSISSPMMGLVSLVSAALLLPGLKAGEHT